MNIQVAGQEKFPAADLHRYFAHLCTSTGSDHKHHILPRIEFPELKEVPENIISLSFQEHFYAHYLLALAVPECASFQRTVYYMANIFADKIKVDELPFFAEVYARGMTEQKEKARSNGIQFTILNKTKVHRERSAKRAIEINSDPVLTAARLKGLRARYLEPEYAALNAARSSACMTKLHTDPVFSANIVENARSINHKRWHAKRGVISASCMFCRAEAH